MSDPLTIPDDKRAGNGRVSLFDPPEHSWSFLIIISIIVGVNGWIDYYHPLGLLFDILFAICLVIVWGRRK